MQNDLMIVTKDKESVLEKSSKVINMVPLRKWLLEGSSKNKPARGFPAGCLLN